jgi:hypothetical protein
LKGKILHEIISVFYHRRFVLYLLLAFAAGCLLSGLFFSRQGSLGIRELDTKYAGELRGAAETIGRLTEALGLERGINRELREHNSRAGDLVEGLTNAAGRNVRNLQEAVVLIGEIRKKLKVLEDFYADRDSGGGAPERGPRVGGNEVVFRQPVALVEFVREKSGTPPYAFIYEFLTAKANRTEGSQLEQEGGNRALPAKKTTD